MDAHIGGMEANNGAWRVFMPMLADLDPFDEGQNPDPHKIDAYPQHFLPRTRMFCHFRAGLQTQCWRIEIRMQRIKNTNPETILVQKYRPILFLQEELMTICLTDF